MKSCRYCARSESDDLGRLSESEDDGGQVDSKKGGSTGGTRWGCMLLDIWLICKNFCGALN